MRFESNLRFLGSTQARVSSESDPSQLFVLAPSQLGPTVDSVLARGCPTLDGADVGMFSYELGGASSAGAAVGGTWQVGAPFVCPSRSILPFPSPLSCLDLATRRYPQNKGDTQRLLSPCPSAIPRCRRLPARLFLLPSHLPLRFPVSSRLRSHFSSLYTSRRSRPRFSPFVSRNRLFRHLANQPPLRQHLPDSLLPNTPLPFPFE